MKELNRVTLAIAAYTLGIFTSAEAIAGAARHYSEMAATQSTVQTDSPTYELKPGQCMLISGLFYVGFDNPPYERVVSPAQAQRLGCKGVRDFNDPSLLNAFSHCVKLSAENKNRAVPGCADPSTSDELLGRYVIEEKSEDGRFISLGAMVDTKIDSNNPRILRVQDTYVGRSYSPLSGLRQDGPNADWKDQYGNRYIVICGIISCDVYRRSDNGQTSGGNSGGGNNDVYGGGYSGGFGGGGSRGSDSGHNPMGGRTGLGGQWFRP